MTADEVTLWLAMLSTLAKESWAHRNQFLVVPCAGRRSLHLYRVDLGTFALYLKALEGG